MPTKNSHLQAKTTENRMGKALFWTLLFIFGFAFAKDKPLSVEKKTLLVLQMGFSEKPTSTQKALLREMSIMNTELAIPFFVTVALDPRYVEEVRYEAVKGMIAVDSKKYRMLLEVLQQSPLPEDRLIGNIQLIEGLDLLEPFLRSLTFQEERRIIDMKISVILRFWNDKIFQRFDFSMWPSDQASEALYSLLQTSNTTNQKIHIIQLWGKARNDKTTKNMIKWLDKKDEKVQEAVIFALSEPGPSAVSALGRFLQKSKNPTLRKRVIFGLRKINNESSRVALQAYLPKSTQEEKVWIEEILKN